MFDHVREHKRAASGLHPAAFVAATALMLGVVGGFVYGSVWLLAKLGLDIRPPMVQVTYDPYGDGRTLEDVQREWREAEEEVVMGGGDEVGVIDVTENSEAEAEAEE